MYKASGFVVDITLPAVTDGRKLMKQIASLLPRGTNIRIRAVKRSLQDPDIDPGTQKVIGLPDVK